MVIREWIGASSSVRVALVFVTGALPLTVRTVFVQVSLWLFRKSQIREDQYGGEKYYGCDDHKTAI